MIEKKRPRKLNSSKDSRVRGADEMYDALNVQVSSDYDGAGSDADGNAGGNVGVLKPAYGNSVNQYFEQFSEQSFERSSSLKVLGNVVDDENDVIYYFVWSSVPKEQGIYAYDPKGFLPDVSGNSNMIKVVYKSPLLNFPSDGFVKGDVVVIQDEGDENQKVKPVIYFTDGVNEPRSINVFLAYNKVRNRMTPGDGGVQSSNTFADDHFDQQDFIHACPKTPVHPPKAFFRNDPNSRSSNFEGISGYQFAYQYIYKGGEESALSTYSDIIIPPAYLQQGAKSSANLSQTNECVIKIPRGSVKDPASVDANGYLTGSVIADATSANSIINRYLPRNVEKIRILVREGNRGAFSVVETIPSGVDDFVTTSDGQDPRGLYTDLQYIFRNDRVKTGFSKDEANKPFDSVPQVAGAQTVASNRLMYGDYVTGYDNVDVSASATITYNSRPEDFKSIDITVRPTIDLLDQDLSVNNRRSGIYFDVDNFPADNIGLSDDSTVDVTITVRPKRNWHIYNANNSFHGSRHIGNLSPNVIEDNNTQNPGNPSTTIQPYQVSPNLASDGVDGVDGVTGEPGTFGSSRSRTNLSSNHSLDTIWGANNGVTLGPSNPKWKTVASQHDVDPNEDGTLSTSTIISGSNSEVPVRYGTSAANPFILRGRPLLFSVSIKLKSNISGSNYKKLLRDFISRAMTWDRDAVDANGDPLYPREVQFNGTFYDSNGVSPYFEILDIKNDYSYTIDEGLDGGNANSTIEDVTGGANKINVTTKGDDRKHLIVAVGNGNIVKEGANPADLRYLPPCGYFIVNRATPTFRLTSRDDIDPTATYGVLQLDLRSLNDVETLTCVPFVDADLWEDKGMKLRNVPEAGSGFGTIFNPGNAEEIAQGQSNQPRGPEGTVYWWNSGIFNSGRFSDPDNWGLRDVTVWQFQTMVIDSWWCFSKEYLVRKPIPEFLFTPLYSDYKRISNGFTSATEATAADIEGVSAGDAVGAPGDLSVDTTNNGVLRNAAVVKQGHIEKLVHENQLGVGGDEMSTGGFGDGVDPPELLGFLHFRHNMRLRVGGDGFYPAIQNTDLGAYNGEGGAHYGLLGLKNKYDKTRARIVGWIDSGLGYIGDNSANIYNTGGVNQPTNNPDRWNSGFTILDGAGGIGGNPTGGEAMLRYDAGKSCAMGTVNGMMLFTGYIGPRDTVLPSKIKDGTKPPFDLDAPTLLFYNDRFSNYFNKFGQDSMMAFLGQFNYTSLSAAGGFTWAPGGIFPNPNTKSLYYTSPLDLGLGDQGQNILDEDNFQNHDWRDDYRDQVVRNQPVVEILDVGGGTVLADEIRSGGRSFKTKANHSFGIVFYDERGRAGRVNPIKIDGSSSLFVEGYDGRDSDELAGRVSIKLKLDDVVERVPDWARHYQIVYAGNSTYSNFIQYSAGGAFVGTFNEGEAEQDSQNIYVSLNYLQGNKDVSYTESFGAVSPSGTKQMYVHSPGDKLRVISYFVSNPIDENGDITGRVYPRDYEFEIVGVENLSGNPEINPLRRTFTDSSDSAVMSDAKTGQFLVLKNNPFAAGFSYDDVKNGENDPSSNKHFWNSICVVEIYSPSQEVADEEQRLYYEIGQVYDIGISDGIVVSGSDGATVMDSGRPYYKTNPVLLEKGDVWFRRVPMAVPKFDTDPDSETFGRFRNLITYDKDNEVGSTPRFQNYFLETEAFNDTFSGNDVLSRGKPNIIDDEFGRSRKKGSIAFSDKHVYDKSKLRFSSFKENSFKDFPSEHGPIRYLMDNYDSIVMIQERKTSAIPVERSILSTADGSNSLVQSKEPLGVQSFYAGDYGCDKNPESVIRAGGAIYFASPKSAEVYRLSIGGGIEVISSIGLKSEFYKTFRYVNSSAGANERVYVPTGYDPVNDEFLITIRKESFTAPSGPVETQGVIGPVAEDTNDDVFGGVDEVISGCTYIASPNFNPFALEDDGNCFVLGCTDPISLNYTQSPQLGVEVILCDSGSTTLVGKEYYNNPFDCACRYFNPCIFDAFSLLPDGKVNYSDVNEFLGLLSNSTFTVPDIPNEYFPNNAQQLFATGVINNLGLDFMWTAGLAVQPPASLAGQPSTSWNFSNDTFDSVAYRFAVAAYTEGPSAAEMQDYYSNSGDPAYTGSIEEIWAQSPDVEWMDTYWRDVNEDVPIWQASWHQANHVTLSGGDDLSTFNGAPEGCVYIGCTDNVVPALNYDPLADANNPCGQSVVGPGNDLFRTPTDENGNCPDGLSECCEPGECYTPFECLECGNPCLDTPVFHTFPCADNPVSPLMGYTNVNPNDDTYGLGSFITSELGSFPNADYTFTQDASNPAGMPVGSLFATSQAALQELRDLVSMHYQQYQTNCVSDATQFVGTYYTENVPCDDTYNPPPTAPIDYYYWIDCCQYKCQGNYPTNASGAMDNTGNADDSLRTEDFVLPLGGGTGIPPCYNGDYPSTDYSVGDLNPDFDYNPNVSGNQPQDD
jgi:hypothetical protein